MRMYKGRHSAEGRALLRRNMFKVMFSAEDHEFVATASGYPSLSYLHPEPDMALDGLLDLVVDTENEMAEEKGGKR